MIKYIIPKENILTKDGNVKLFKDVIYNVNSITNKQLLGKHWIAIDIKNKTKWIYDNKIIKLDEIDMRKYKIEKIKLIILKNINKQK